MPKANVAQLATHLPRSGQGGRSSRASALAGFVPGDSASPKEINAFMANHSDKPNSRILTLNVRNAYRRKADAIRALYALGDRYGLSKNEGNLWNKRYEKLLTNYNQAYNSVKRLQGNLEAVAMRATHGSSTNTATTSSASRTNSNSRHHARTNTQNQATRQSTRTRQLESNLQLMKKLFVPHQEFHVPKQHFVGPNGMFNQGLLNTRRRETLNRLFSTGSLNPSTIGLRLRNIERQLHLREKLKRPMRRK
jgi:hypothetical protein